MRLSWLPWEVKCCWCRIMYTIDLKTCWNEKKAEGIFTVSEGSSLIKQTQGRLTQYLHAGSLFYLWCLSDGSSSQWAWSCQENYFISQSLHEAGKISMWLILNETECAYGCACTHNAETHRDGQHTKTFPFPFFIYLWFRILIGWNDVCGSLRVII